MDDSQAAIVKAFRALGADIAVTYLNEKARKHVEPLAKALEAPIFMPLDVMVEGESGIMTVAHPARRPIYEPSKRRLTWPKLGAIATTGELAGDDPLFEGLELKLAAAIDTAVAAKRLQMKCADG